MASTFIFWLVSEMLQYKIDVLKYAPKTYTTQQHIRRKEMGQNVLKCKPPVCGFKN
jgi:hypothetical protein